VPFPRVRGRCPGRGGEWGDRKGGPWGGPRRPPWSTLASSPCNGQNTLSQSWPRKAAHGKGGGGWNLDITRGHLLLIIPRTSRDGGRSGMTAPTVDMIAIMVKEGNPWHGRWGMEPRPYREHLQRAIPRTRRDGGRSGTIAPTNHRPAHPCWEQNQSIGE